MKNPVIKISTGLGDLIAELKEDRAPLTVRNFLEYVEKELFDETEFFRIVTLENGRTYPNHGTGDVPKIEVIQGGIPPNGETLLPNIAHEPTNVSKLKHLRGTLSMARFEPGTANGSFFICVGNQPELDFGGTRYPDGQGFAAFGKIIGGYTTLDSIFGSAEEVEYTTHPIRITKIRRLE